MKACIFFLIISMICTVVTGCGDAEAKVAKNKNGAVVSISISESGGEDGRINEWKVYREGDRYILSFEDRFHDSPEVFEITEQEYDEIMSLDYAKHIREYDASLWERVADAIHYRTEFTYENGETEYTEALMSEATVMMYDLVLKYRNG